MTAVAVLPAVRVGRPPICPPTVAARVCHLRGQGFSLREIADQLNQEGVATPSGSSMWTKWTVDRLVHTAHYQLLAVELADSPG